MTEEIGKQRMEAYKEFVTNSLASKFVQLFVTDTHVYMYDGVTYMELNQEGSSHIDREYVLSKAMLYGKEAIRDMELGEQTYSKYPNYLKRKVREIRFNIDEYDISHDPEIEDMSPMSFFKSVCQYDEGLLGSYSDTIVSWVYDVFEVDLNEIER